MVYRRQHAKERFPDVVWDLVDQDAEDVEDSEVEGMET